MLGLWACALLWPFVHSGGYPDAFFLSLTPVLLQAGDQWLHWSLRYLHWSVVLYLELCLAWGRWVPLGAIDAAFHGVVHQLLTLSPSQWTQISAHVATPFVLLGCLVGWGIFRVCDNYRRVVALLVIGVVMICVGHALWNLPAEFALASYLTIGLALLVWVHRREFTRAGADVNQRGVLNTLSVLVVLIPVIVGFEAPSHPPVNLGGLLSGYLTAFGTNTATTGYGAGVTEIDHSLVPNQAPVFVAHANAPYYWQAATYTTFNGLSWSNRGPSSTFEQLAGGSDVPILGPYFEGSHTVRVNATITDLARRPFTSLFYTGAPLKFSLTSIVHTRSGRILAPGARSYTVSALEPLYSPGSLDTRGVGVAPQGLRADLELPAGLSPRVGELARRVVGAGTSGAFNVAMMIKHYLDTHYRYSYQVHTSTSDIVNEFLFVGHQGYCDQFSTAFIMMMRSLGIPARWVVGYDPGTYVKSLGGYLIRQVDAHSWAQIWIQGDGWVPVDPTPGFHFPHYSTVAATTNVSPSRPSPTPTSPVVAPAPAPSLNAQAHLRKVSAPTVSRRTTQHGSSNVVSEELTGIGVLLLVSGAIAVWQWRRRSSLLHDTVKQWADLQRLSRRSFGPNWRSDSPREWGESWTNQFPHDTAIVWPLVRLFETAFYAERSLTPEQRLEARRLWRTIRGRARRLRQSRRT